MRREQRGLQHAGDLRRRAIEPRALQRRAGPHAEVLGRPEVVLVVALVGFICACIYALKGEKVSDGVGGVGGPFAH